MSDYAKPSPHTDALDTLGSIIGPNEKRDAIHLAVFPTTAGEELEPGAHVAIKNGVAVEVTPEKGFGIVDPFLNTNVEEGQMFWLVVYPRQISSLRHVWEHPSFPASGETDAPPANPLAPEDKKESEAWLRNWIANSDCPDFHTVVAAACGEGDDSWDAEYMHFNGRDAHGDIPAEFWFHMSVYTGKQFNPADNPKYFSCSC